ncbi:glycosyltransferase [Arthrobacter sp. SA17]
MNESRVHGQPDNASAPRSISVLVGTDHHEFSRLVDWADGWAAEHPQDKVTVQFGHSRAPASAEGHSFMSPAALAELMAASDIVVAHGGPATISGARAAGHVPLVLPRDPALGEHVDDHQQRFASWSAQRSLVTKVVSVPELQERVSALAGKVQGPRAETWMLRGRVTTQQATFPCSLRRQGLLPTGPHQGPPWSCTSPAQVPRRRRTFPPSAVRKVP